MSTTIPLPPSPPYVNFKMTPTPLIGSTPTLIFSAFNDADPALPTPCIIDSIEFLNTTSETIIVTTYVLYETGSDPISADYDYTTIGPLERKEIILNQALTLNGGDLLYAYSDFSSNIFNAFVTGRLLNELTGV